ncbi:hypothetical protein ACOX9X_06455 [Photobacterium leiognathi subsp. mandapamensis]|uniref:hypothetical protein n=1 Tax=Photobacterium leiognathi TaxID=553611 RepID=UPI003BF571E4
MRKDTVNKVVSTALSNFVRNTSPEEKEKIFKKILAVVCDTQNKTITEAKKLSNRNS